MKSPRERSEGFFYFRIIYSRAIIKQDDSVYQKQTADMRSCHRGSQKSHYAVSIYIERMGIPCTAQSMPGIPNQAGILRFAQKDIKEIQSLRNVF